MFYGLRFLVSRLAKLVASIVKGGFFAVHSVWPGLRLDLPANAPPLMSAKERRIPRIVWQTNYSRSVSLAVYVNRLVNRLMAPTHTFRLLVDDDIEAFVRENFPTDIHDAYMRLQIGAAKADLWRLLVLKKFGGVYIDIDASLVWPLESIIGPDDDEVFLMDGGMVLTNYFVATEPNSTHIDRLIERVVTNIETGTVNSVFHLTGPIVFREVLDGANVKRLRHRTVCHQGNFTNEFFQYIDRPARKWTREELTVKVVKD